MPEHFVKRIVNLDDVQPDVLGHQIKIGIEVDNLECMFGTEGADQNIYCLANVHTLRSEKSTVGCRFHRNAETDHIKLGQGQEKR